MLVEYPREGTWAVGFLTGPAADEINEVTDEDAVAVFLPTTPNPTSGYLLFFPRSKVKPLRMTVEDGFKLIISGGAVTPEMARPLPRAELGRPVEVK